MQPEDYRGTLEDALENLFEVNRKIYDSIIPIAMARELSEWNMSVPIGEIIILILNSLKTDDDFSAFVERWQTT